MASDAGCQDELSVYEEFEKTRLLWPATLVQQLLISHTSSREKETTKEVWVMLHLSQEIPHAASLPIYNDVHYLWDHVNIGMKGHPRSIPTRGSNSQTGSSDHSSALPTPSAGPSVPLPANSQSTSKHQRANELPTSSTHQVDAKVPVLLQTARA